MRSLDELLVDAAAMHRGCLCPGQVLGVRIAMRGCRRFEIDEPTQGKRLIVYVDIDRCMADAIAAVTGCRLGKRTLKHMDYGKCACTFVDTSTGHAIRISARDDARSNVWRYASFTLDKNTAQRDAYKIMPDDKLFIAQEVLVDIPDHDQPGRPVSRVICALCNEGINDRREVRLNGQVLCRACAQGSYYLEVEQKVRHRDQKDALCWRNVLPQRLV